MINSIFSYCEAPMGSAFSYQPGESIALGVRSLLGQEVKTQEVSCQKRNRFLECVDVLTPIFSYLDNPEDVIACRLTCRGWRFGGRLAKAGTDEETAVERNRRLIQSFIQTNNFFGAADWMRQGFGVKGSKIPIELGRILEGPCPYFEGKQVKETHMLFLLPKEVNGKPFTAKQFEGRSDIRYRYFNNVLKAQFGDASPDRSRWILMTKDVIPGSRSKSFDEQQGLVRQVPGYEIPEMLAAITGIFTHLMKSGEMLYPDGTGRPDSIWTYTRCQEKTVEGYHVLVGGLGGSGLNVHDHYNDYESLGVGALRKFFGT